MGGRGRRASVVLFTFLLSQGFVAGSDVQVSPSYLLVNPKDDVTLMCKLNGKLDLCLFKVAGKGYNMKPGKEKDGISYQGAGLEKGECGITIHNVDEKHNGNITCSLALDTADPTEQSGNIQIVVASAPQRPVLEVSVDSKSRINHVYQEQDRLLASCTVPTGRPAANITWFLGGEVILEGLRQPIETCNQQNRDFCTIKQNLTRILQASDDKKVLRCVANHFSLKGKELYADYNINVNYPPKLPAQPIEQFGLVEGMQGRVPVIVEANPKPVVIWTVGTETIHEGTTVGRYTVLPTHEVSPGKYETVLIIDSLTKEDTAIDYKVKAHNELGDAQYDVSISTSPEPKVLEMGAGLIITIVFIILLILVVLGAVLYIRANGKFCFAVGSADKRVAPPSEGAENPAVNHHASSEYITNSPQLKKEKPKEDTPV